MACFFLSRHLSSSSHSCKIPGFLVGWPFMLSPPIGFPSFIQVLLKIISFYPAASKTLHNWAIPFINLWKTFTFTSILIKHLTFTMRHIIFKKSSPSEIANSCSYHSEIKTCSLTIPHYFIQQILLVAMVYKAPIRCCGCQYILVHPGCQGPHHPVKVTDRTTYLTLGKIRVGADRCTLPGMPWSKGPSCLGQRGTCPLTDVALLMRCPICEKCRIIFQSFLQALSLRHHNMKKKWQISLWTIYHL